MSEINEKLPENSGIKERLLQSIRSFNNRSTDYLNSHPDTVAIAPTVTGAINILISMNPNIDTGYRIGTLITGLGNFRTARRLILAKKNGN